MQGDRNCGLEECKVAKILRPCVVADLNERSTYEKRTDLTGAVL